MNWQIMLCFSVTSAAEGAAREAKPVSVSAIKKMTMNYAANTLLGRQNDVANQYFKCTANDQLLLKFQPLVQNSLNTSGATRYWADAIAAYNKIPLVSKVNPNL